MLKRVFATISIDVKGIHEYKNPKEVIQHYKAIEHFGGEKSFKKTKMRDVIKKTFCEESNIGFRIIRYDEDVNIEMNKIITQSALN